MTNDEPEPEKHEARAVDRLIFFSDAVTAIAITLLAIDLRVPEGATASAFWSSARQNDGQYLVFLVSFIAIAAAWSDHHDAFRHIRRADTRLRNLNMICARFTTGVSAQAGKAACAVSITAFTSDTGENGTRAIVLPVEGL